MLKLLTLRKSCKKVKIPAEIGNYSDDSMPGPKLKQNVRHSDLFVRIFIRLARYFTPLGGLNLTLV